MPRPDSSNGDFHAGPNGDGSANGSAATARRGGRTCSVPRTTTAADAGASPHYSYRGLGWLSGIILAFCVLMAGGMLVAWWHDPVVRILVLLFVSATAAVAGTVAGIVLVPLGLSRNRRGLWVTGLIVGVISFAAMITRSGGR